MSVPNLENAACTVHEAWEAGTACALAPSPSDDYLTLVAAGKSAKLRAHACVEDIDYRAAQELIRSARKVHLDGRPPHR